MPFNVQRILFLQTLTQHRKYHHHRPEQKVEQKLHWWRLSLMQCLFHRHIHPMAEHGHRMVEHDRSRHDQSMQAQ
jgi:hypothetical protein